MSRKKKHPKVYRRTLKFLRDFKTGEQVYWVTNKTEHLSVGEVFTGRVICLNDKNGHVRVVCHENGRELWLKNSQPCPVPFASDVPTETIMLDGWGRNLKPEQCLRECWASGRRDVTLQDVERRMGSYDEEYRKRFGDRPFGALSEFAVALESLGYKGVTKLVENAIGKIQNAT